MIFLYPTDCNIYSTYMYYNFNMDMQGGVGVGGNFYAVTITCPWQYFAELGFLAFHEHGNMKMYVPVHQINHKSNIRFGEIMHNCIIREFCWCSICMRLCSEFAATHWQSAPKISHISHFSSPWCLLHTRP